MVAATAAGRAVMAAAGRFARVLAHVAGATTSPIMGDVCAVRQPPLAAHGAAAPPPCARRSQGRLGAIGNWPRGEPHAAQ